MRSRDRLIQSMLLATVLAGVALSSGCKTLHPYTTALPTQVVGDPILPPDGAVIGDPGLVDARPVTFVDRHPLLRKPVEYYHKTNHGCVGKLAAATFIGVPAGIIGEAVQIIAGCPPATLPY